MLWDFCGDCLVGRGNGVKRSSDTERVNLAESQATSYYSYRFYRCLFVIDVIILDVVITGLQSSLLPISTKVRCLLVSLGTSVVEFTVFTHTSAVIVMR